MSCFSCCTKSDMPLVPTGVLSLNDVSRVDITRDCQATFPCQGHICTVTLNSGITATTYKSFEICALVSSVAKSKINPETSWEPEDVKQHFSKYGTSDRLRGYKAEKFDPVLNRLFARQQS